MKIDTLLGCLMASGYYSFPPLSSSSVGNTSQLGNIFVRKIPQLVYKSRYRTLVQSKFISLRLNFIVEKLQYLLELSQEGDPISKHIKTCLTNATRLLESTMTTIDADFIHQLNYLFEYFELHQNKIPKDIQIKWYLNLKLVHIHVSEILELI
jgi:hypothetical protein